MELRRWLDGTFSEVEFWDVWMRSRGARWPEEFRERLRDDSPFDVQAAALLPSEPAGIRVLDVGSGPLCGTGLILHNRKLDITATDPLAFAYQEMYCRYSIEPPVRTTLAFAEDLSVFFPANTFDLVTCKNALDHSLDPVRGLTQMLEVAKPNGFVLLQHQRNEALNEDYSGLHQWNFDVDDAGDFVIANRETRVNVSKEFAEFADTRVVQVDELDLVVTLTKRQAASLLAKDSYRERLREVLLALGVAAATYHRDDWFVRQYYRCRIYAGYVMKRLRRNVGGRVGLHK
jgi:SAM-dependent methyltransferase